MELTLDQQRAMAMASARQRASQGGTPPEIAETEADVQRMEAPDVAALPEPPSKWELFKRGLAAIAENPALIREVGPGRLPDSIVSGATLPGDVYSGKEPLPMPTGMSREQGGRVLDLAGMAIPVAPEGLLPRAAADAPMALTVHPSPSQQVVEAAGRLDVPVPRALATDNPVAIQAGAALRNVPFAGTALTEAADRTVAGLGAAADRTASSLGGASMERAGAAAGEGLSDWMGAGSKAVSDRLYDRVADLVPADVAVPLANTERVVEAITARRGNAKITGDSKAVSEVRGAVESKPAVPAMPDGSPIPPKMLDQLRASGQIPAAEGGGLNFQGIKDLRSHVGELFKRPPEGMSGSELKAIYGALSADLRVAAAAGGPKAVTAFERANTIHAQVEARREALRKVLGRDGDASPAVIYDRLVSMAGSKSRADTARLVQARKAMGPDAWNEFAGGVVGKLGRDVEGNLSPDRFLSDYGKLSSAGKDVLFNSTGSKTLRQSLDDIATVSSRIKERGKLANPSGTARNVGFAAMGTGLVASPIHTAATVFGGTVLARILAEPVTAASMAKWAKAYEAHATAPSPRTAAVLDRMGRNLTGTVAARLGVTVAAELLEQRGFQQRAGSDQ